MAVTRERERKESAHFILSGWWRGGEHVRACAMAHAPKGGGGEGLTGEMAVTLMLVPTRSCLMEVV